MGMTGEERKACAARRKARIFDYVSPEPLRSVADIQSQEGITYGPLRKIVRELEVEQGITYIGIPVARGGPSCVGASAASPIEWELLRPSYLWL